MLAGVTLSLVIDFVVGTWAHSVETAVRLRQLQGHVLLLSRPRVHSHYQVMRQCSAPFTSGSEVNVLLSHFSLRIRHLVVEADAGWNQVKPAHHMVNHCSSQYSPAEPMYMCIYVYTYIYMCIYICVCMYFLFSLSLSL